MKTVHRISAVIAFLTITTFLVSTAAAELSGSESVIVTVKQAIVYGLALLVPAMAAAGVSGQRLAKQRGLNPRMRKAKRMRIAAVNAVLVLIPAAFYLRSLAVAGNFGATFWSIQALELAFGSANWALLALNVRDGRRLARAGVRSRTVT